MTAAIPDAPGGPAPLEIVGHRGYSAMAPENTLSALRAAVESGADAVEFDLHVAACGTPVLFHDTNLGRTTNGVGPVRRRTLGQLQVLDAGSWFSSDFEGERIPTLTEALEAISGRVARAYAEVKGYRELEDLDRMVSLAREQDALDSLVFISLDWGVVDRIAGRDPDLQVGLVVDGGARFDEGLERIAASGRGLLTVAVDVLLEDPGRARRARERGIELGAWTVNDPDRAEALARQGVTRFTTDRVEELLDWRNGRTERSAG